MVSQTAIAVTALLQMLGKSVFVAQPKVECSPAPALGGTIFLLAMLMLIWDCNIIPQLYRQRAPWAFTVVEVLATVFVTELIIHLGWCSYERIVYRVVRVVCYHRMWCELGMMTAVTILGAFAALCVVVEVVCPARVKDSLGEVLDSLPVPAAAGPFVHYIQDVRSYLMGAIYFTQLTREQRLLAVRAFELQVRHSTIPQDEPEEELSEEHQESPEQEQETQGRQGNLTTEIPQDEPLEEPSDEQAEEQSEEQAEEQSEEQAEEQWKNPEEATQDLQDPQADGCQPTEPKPEPEPESVEESKA